MGYPDTYPAFRVLAALLFLLDLLHRLPRFGLFFGRYQPEGLLRRRWGRIAFGLAWASAVGTLLSGRFALPGALVLVLVYRLIHVERRFTSLYRTGAPGLMAYWTSVVILLVELAVRLDGAGDLADTVITVARIDFGVIMLGAGISKALSGYANNRGIQYPVLNPMWNRFWTPFARLSPEGPVWPATNVGTFVLEAASGVLLLFPSTRTAGALIVAAGFLLMTPLFRLDRLCPLMAAIPLLFLPAQWLPEIALPASSGPDPLLTGTAAAAAGGLLRAVLFGYVGALPVIKAVQYSNYYFDHSWPEPLQSIATRIAEAVPVVIWRVFTADIGNYFLRVHLLDDDQEKRRTVFDPTGPDARTRPGLPGRDRFTHATELISLTSTVNYCKYQGLEAADCREKLLAWSATVLDDPAFEGAGDSDPAARSVILEYVSVMGSGDTFTFVPRYEIEIDPAAGRVGGRSLEGWEWRDDVPASSAVKKCEDDSYLTREERA